MLLGDLFDLSLVGRASEAALDLDAPGGGTRTLTFGEIDAARDAWPRCSSAGASRAGDRVAVHLPNRVEFIDLFLACVRLGVIFVPMNVLYREREIAHIVGDADPALIVDRAAAIAGSRPARQLVDVDDAVARRRGGRVPPSRSHERPALDGDEPAVIVYTSGTTGRSKGAVLSHNNFAANATSDRGVLAHHGARPLPRRAAAVSRPRAGQRRLQLAASAAAACGCSSASTIARARGAVRDFKPTLFFGVPTIYVRLLDPAGLTTAARAIGATRAAVRLRLGAAARARPRGVSRALRPHDSRALRHERGAHDHDAIRTRASGAPARWDRRCPASRRASSTRTARCSATATSARSRFARRNVFAEYWRTPDATAAAFHDGWFRTGDLGVRSGDGYYTLRGRRGDLIIRGGFNIYPREIEELLLEDAARARGGGRRRARRRARRGADRVHRRATTHSTLPSSRRAVARSWRRSRCRARSFASTRCRGPRSARCRSICCRHSHREKEIAMNRRQFVISSATAVAGAAMSRTGWGQSAPAWTRVKPATLERISIMTLNFQSLLKLPDYPDSPDRTLEPFTIAEMLADRYGVHKVEFQHYHIPSTELCT